MRLGKRQAAFVTVTILALAVGSAPAEVEVESGASMTYLANRFDPGLGLSWTLPAFDDASWSVGVYGVGYEVVLPGASNLLQTVVPSGSLSVYTRTSFTITDVSNVQRLLLGADYDDGFVAWINGVEVYRSPEMPPGAPDWNTPPIAPHESSNAAAPNYAPLQDISASGIPALQNGQNLLAVGAYNLDGASSDLVLVPELRSSPLARDPYLQMGSDSEITVRWRTAGSVGSRVDYGSQPGNLTSTIQNPNPATDHAVTLTGLAPDTRYYYAVGTPSQLLVGDDPEHYFVTAPTAGTARDTRIWILGDSGRFQTQATAVRNVFYAFGAGREVDLWLMLGDNAYPDGTDAEYQEKLFDVYPETLATSVLWPTLGNHDGVSASSATQSGPYYDIFTLPAMGQVGGLSSGTEAYYSFDRANVHFVVLNSHDVDRSATAAMATWLQQDLASTTQDWIIGYWHHPPYSKGSHDSDTELAMVEMRTNLVPILEDHGVDLVFTGHSHNYERSFLIDGHYGDSTTFIEAFKVDGGDGRVDGDGAYAKPMTGTDPHQGAIFSVAGSSSQITGGSLDHPAMYLSLNVLGSVVLDVDENRLDATFLDATGLIQDRYTLFKGCANPTSLISSDNPGAGNHSDLFTPGMCDGGPPCSSDIGSSVSSSLEGSFWAVGAGDPSIHIGADSGDYPALSGWVSTLSGDPAFIDSRWDADRRIDECPDTGDDCLAVAVVDQDGFGQGYFAALTAEVDPAGDFFFDQPAGGPITLALTPKPLILGSSQINPYTVRVTTAVNQIPPEGLYLDGPPCDAGVVVGYKVYEQRTTRSGPPPVDRNRDTGWILADGGAGSAGEPIPIGTSTDVTFTCFTAVDVYMGAALVFESGYESPVLSRNSSQILCSFCEVDDDMDGSCALFLGGGAGPDCDDGDPTTWGIPGVARQLRFETDPQMLLWDPPEDLGGTAVVYDTLRSPAAGDFTSSGQCIEVGDPLDLFTIDGEVPAAGSAFHYLVRAGNGCGNGSLGAGAGGTPRGGISCL